jgi:hypothetical protein
LEVGYIVNFFKRLFVRPQLNREFLSAAESRGDRGIGEVRRLIAAGADIEARTQYGDTALQRAVINNNLGMVELLITLGADINAKHTGEWGGTALTCALHFQHLGIIKCLLDAGADTEVRDAKGETPLMYATRPKGHLEAPPTLPSIIALLEAHPGSARDLPDRLVSSGFGPEAPGQIEGWDFSSREFSRGSQGAPSLKEALRKILQCLRYEADGTIEAYGFYMKGQTQHFCGNLRSTCAALCEDDCEVE